MSNSAFTVVGGGGGQGAAQGWLIASSIGGVATNNGSFNVAMLTYISTGNLRITFTTPFASANYVGVGSIGAGTNMIVSNQALQTPYLGDPTSSTFEVQASGSTGLAQESPFINVAFFGTQ